MCDTPNLNAPGFEPIQLLSLTPRSVVAVVRSEKNLELPTKSRKLFSFHTEHQPSPSDLFVMKSGAANGPVQNELKSLQALGHHPHIVSLLDHFLCENLSCCRLVLEKVPGRSVLDLLKEKGKLSEEETVVILRQVAKALTHIHAHSMVHRDVKPENILFDDETKIAKLIDFEFCCPVSEIQEPKGTKLYLPPEAWKPAPLRRPGTWFDVWSFGVTLFVMVLGVFPYSATQLEKDVGPFETDVFTPEIVNEKVSPSCYDLLEQTLQVQPHFRPSMKQVQLHAWMKKATLFDKIRRKNSSRNLRSATSEG